jgi:hypothetical protein
MKQPTPKTDRLRELREAKHSVYSKGRTISKPDGGAVTAGDLKVGGLYEIDLNTATIKPTKAEKLATAKKALKSK